MKNPKFRLYGLVAVAVIANTVVMGMILGVAVVNEVQFINQMELGS
ncbi:MAG: hypothetical protein AAFX80_05180 [Cyanobacteria bacterium J06639_18]